MNIKLAELISKNKGELPSHLTDEAYPVYYTTIQGLVLCPYCANLILKGESPFKNKIIADDLEDYKINWDNYDLECERGHHIDSATLEVDLSFLEGVKKHANKRKIPNKIRHIKLHGDGKQASPGHR